MLIHEICAQLTEHYAATLLSDIQPAPPSDVDIYIPATTQTAAAAWLAAQGFIQTSSAPGQIVFRRFENNGQLYVLDLMSRFTIYTRQIPDFELSDAGVEYVGRNLNLHRCLKRLCTGQLDRWNEIATSTDYVAFRDFLTNAKNFSSAPDKLAAAAAKGPQTLYSYLTRDQTALRRTRRLQYLQHILSRYGKGRSFAFIGPDGSGKSFFITKLRECGETREIYMGDWFFKAQGVYNAVMRIPSPFNRFVYIFYFLENLLRFAKVCFWRRMGKIVLIDRYPGTSRNVTQTGLLRRLNDLIYRCFPKPDLFVLLLAPPEVVHTRKQELTVDEIRRTQDDLRHLIRQDRHLLVDTTDLDISLNRLLREMVA